jgi:hypothetical protein
MSAGGVKDREEATPEEKVVDDAETRVCQALLGKAIEIKS